MLHSSMTLDQVAKLMVHNDCGEIPVIDGTDQPIGVITDRDIVCRVVAEGKNPVGYTAEQFMSQPVITVTEDTPIDEVVTTMEKHQIRRVPVVDANGSCAGMIAGRRRLDRRRARGRGARARGVARHRCVASGVWCVASGLWARRPAAVAWLQRRLDPPRHTSEIGYVTLFSPPIMARFPAWSVS
jgi:predicted transcriptional regulator